MAVKAVKAPGLNVVPTGQPSPRTRRTSRAVGTPHTHEPWGSITRFTEGGRTSCSKGSRPRRSRRTIPSVDDALELR
jgi:hypothetical protein